mmetsp:Transcript_80717/g.216358  ORF Transcript_80717/g.216358 Transcript_80717/m.216358 type:complete len:103 (+) Transcript_80717:380-688(+)
MAAGKQSSKWDRCWQAMIRMQKERKKPELGESMHAWKTILIFGCRKGRRKTSEEATSTRVITENILITEKQTIGNMETRSLVSTIALQLYKKVLKHSVEIFI